MACLAPDQRPEVPVCQRHRGAGLRLSVPGGETVVKQCRMAELEQRCRPKGWEGCMSVSWILKGDTGSAGENR